MQLKEYQDIAVGELLTKAKRLLNLSGRKKLVFSAPTGSGKTTMVAEFLKRLVTDRELNQNLSFIWAAPRQLHIQSKKSLEEYYETSRALKCSYFDDLDDINIDENEILFFNWESINKADNIYISKNEENRNLSNVIQGVRDAGRKLILIIDECHFSADAPAANKLRNDIDADLTIEVSATPVLSGDLNVNVMLEDVKKEGMIKKAVLLNPDLNNIVKKQKIVSDLSKDSEEVVINTAIDKRLQILKTYRAEKSNINPLILIQLPDRRTLLEDIIKEKVTALLRDKYKITTENGKLAICLSGDHVNLENISKPDNEVEVLIFKQALALGWDCPRAQILVLFRDWKSLVFSIQTIGRIMRMPEPIRGYYDSQILNYGYVYTNLADIEIQEDLARDYISIFKSKRLAKYTPINLLSCHSKRLREKTRLSPRFIQIFLQIAEKYNLKSKININARKVDLRVISDWRAEDLDKLRGAKISGSDLISMSEFDLQKTFDFFVRQNLTPFYPEDRSIGRVKESIYGFFMKYLKMHYEYDQEKIIQITLSEKNIQHFTNVINETKIAYQNEVLKQERELVFNNAWNVPEEINFSSNYAREDRFKSIMQLFFSENVSEPEKKFIDFIDKNNNVVWWFKNGSRDATFFAVPYEKDGQPAPFYVDFIILTIDGRIGLFDTKEGFTADIAKPKAEGLQKYIKEQNKTGKNLWGGIVKSIKVGSWAYNSEEKYDSKKVSDWKILEI